MFASKEDRKPEQRTLQLTFPAGGTLILALAFVLVGTLALETVARSELAHQSLPSPSLGTGHGVFDGQVSRLDAFVLQRGRVDCVFFGGSTVFRGIDPEVVARAYGQGTGEHLVSFNFGVSGLTRPDHVRQVAEFLVDQYHPGLLVWGTHVLQVDERNARPWQKVLSSHWFRQQRGDRSPYGWLLTNSRAAGQLVRVLEAWTSGRISRQVERANRATPYGYFPGPVKPRPAGARTASEFASRLRGYDPAKVGMAATLERLHYLTPRTQVILLAMPASSELTRLVPGGDAGYERALETLDRLADEKGIALWRSPPRSDFTDESWADRTHLSPVGARAFSAWLGTELARAVEKGRLRDPRR